MGPTQLTEVLRQLPQSTDPNLLVGFDTRDDAGVYLLPDGKALVQTVDFFTPVVDDPYAYGSIAAANALSDVYAMGGVPLTVLNIACFDPGMAEPAVWAAVFKGMFDKVAEAGAVVVGGHSVEDSEPKFGMAVTGIVDPAHVFSNRNAQVGDRLWLSKPLGTGVITTAAKNDGCSPETLKAAIDCMSQLNAEAAKEASRVQARCATDITGFGLAGHASNIAVASHVVLEFVASALPVLPQVRELIGEGFTTGGGGKTKQFLGDALQVGSDWIADLVVDPQTSGGLLVCSPHELAGFVEVGQVVSGTPAVRVL